MRVADERGRDARRLATGKTARLPARREEPADFDEFWAGTLRAAAEAATPARFDRYDAGLSTVEVYDVTFAGYAGQPVRGWLLLPARTTGPLPCVVEYIGYGNGRGLPHDWLFWSAAGYAHLVMDTRGQGTQGSPPATPPTRIRRLPRRPTASSPGASRTRRTTTTGGCSPMRCGPCTPPASTRGSTRTGSWWPVAARAAASPWPWPAWSTGWRPCCRTCRSCATTGGPARSPTPCRTRSCGPT